MQNVATRSRIYPYTTSRKSAPVKSQQPIEHEHELLNTAQLEASLSTELPTTDNHFDRHIACAGQHAPHWIAWLKAI